jgi:hypothetical protein
MKIIEAMKQIKANKEKVAELIQRIQRNSAHLSIESPQYENQADKVREWTQSCLDVSRDNVELLVRIAKTNLATPVTIDLGGKSVTKSIAEWVWRRREYAGVDKAIWLSQGDRNLKEGMVQSSPGVMTDVKLIRYYDPAQRDTNADIHMREPHQIDAALEVVNATTDLL